MRPGATAAFLPPLGVMSSIPPVAILLITTAVAMAPKGRFSPFGPLGKGLCKGQRSPEIDGPNLSIDAIAHPNVDVRSANEIEHDYRLAVQVLDRMFVSHCVSPA